MYKAIEETIGNTPLVRFRKVWRGKVTVLCKLEFANPGGSVKDRIALSMIRAAERSGRLKAGGRIIEATSGNTGITLSLLCAALGYRLTILMSENANIERKQIMRAYGATLLEIPEPQGIEKARDIAVEMEKEGKGINLNQFANEANPLAHYEGTAPEIWRDTQGKITHFVASTGTTGTLMGSSRYLKEKNPAVRIIAVYPKEGDNIPGIRKWDAKYQPKIFDSSRVDDMREVSYEQALATSQRVAREEGIFCGISSGGNISTALKVAEELEHEGSHDSVVVVIVCDNGERYLSTKI